MKNEQEDQKIKRTAGSTFDLLIFLFIFLSGCGEAAFSAHARDNDPGDLARAMSASAQPAARAAHPM
ncbi:MAG TPA: hypothetical protein VF997_18890, partial [Polyangia bacterium]